MTRNTEGHRSDTTERVRSSSGQTSDLDPRAFNYFVNGVIYEQAGHPVNAVKEYRRALQYQQDSYEIRFSCALVLNKLHRYEEILDILEAIDPEDVAVYRLRAMAYGGLGKAGSVRTEFLKAVALDSLDKGPYSYLAGFYQNIGDIDSTIWAFQNLARLSPDDFTIWYKIGKLQTEKGNITAAKDAFKKSIGLSRKRMNILSFVLLAELYENEGQPDSVLETCEAALQIDPDNIVLNRYLAAFYLKSDSLEHALKYARKVVEVSPLDRTAVRRVGLIYYGLDSLQAADSVFRYL
ncbi:MAG: hypothetical protein U9R56_00575, partial [candidate division Zixibacteria bacterium]|nr:hypothetical protein [candidate division Zixibacteria bacterium]